jgi:putative lipoic acid-binding regulatory protein
LCKPKNEALGPSRHWGRRYNEAALNSNRIASAEMNSPLPTHELLEKSHAFPGPYLFKVIGKSEDSFLARIIAVVREELLIEVDPPFHVRETAGGRHVSITMEPVVQSAQQVIAIYCRLRVVDGVVMLF